VVSTLSAVSTLHTFALLLAAPTPSPEPPGVQAATTTWTSPQVVAAIVAAGVAVAVGVGSMWLQRRSARETVTAANRSADAAALSAASSDRSAQVAADAVQLNREVARDTAERVRAEAFAKRYQDAAAQLGHERAAVRLAGVYSMARLADDWADQRQVCVDVLTAYLRIPAELETDAKPFGEQQVRRVITLVMEKHLHDDSKFSWRPLDFDFTDAHLLNFTLRDCSFDGAVSFRGATFDGECRLNEVRFGKSGVFDRATVTGRLIMTDVIGAGFNGLRLQDCVIERGGLLEFTTATVDPRPDDGPAQFHRLTVHGEARFFLPPAPTKARLVIADDCSVAGGKLTVRPRLTLRKGADTSARMRLRDLRYDSGAEITIDQALIDDGRLELSRDRTVMVSPDDATLNFTFPDQAE